MDSKHTVIQIHPNDNTAVALTPLKKDSVLNLDGHMYLLSEDIPQGHKFALIPIHPGEPVIKYGFPIGSATQEIPVGCWIHTHNMKTGLGDLLEYSYQKEFSSLPPLEERFFDGYRRTDGKAGVRNEIWIIPTVGCVNSVATLIADKAKAFQPESVDAIVAFPHPYGCSQMGNDQEHPRQILADLIQHPNAAGVLVLGLGCENSNIDELKKYIGTYDENRVKFLVAQEVEDEVETSLSYIRQLCDYASTFHREKISCKELIIGMKCGSAPVMDVLSYGETVQTSGLNLLSAPGNDLVASTALAASGAQIVLFTTGRGTPFASPVPTVKISSNSRLYETKKNWIDFNCGALTDGGSVSEMGAALFDYVLEVASGRLVKSEEAGFHDMAIFKQGVTL